MWDFVESVIVKKASETIWFKLKLDFCMEGWAGRAINL